MILPIDTPTNCIFYLNFLFFPLKSSHFYQGEIESKYSAGLCFLLKMNNLHKNSPSIYCLFILSIFCSFIISHMYKVHSDFNCFASVPSQFYYPTISTFSHLWHFGCCYLVCIILFDPLFLRLLGFNQGHLCDPG